MKQIASNKTKKIWKLWRNEVWVVMLMLTTQNSKVQTRQKSLE